MHNNYMLKIFILVIIVVLSIFIVQKQISIPGTDKTILVPTTYPSPTYKPTASPVPKYNPEDYKIPESIYPQFLPSGWSREPDGTPYYQITNSETRIIAGFQLTDSDYMGVSHLLHGLLS
jgi:hypothetical protein